jgi:hypothetical protein
MLPLEGGPAPQTKSQEKALNPEGRFERDLEQSRKELREMIDSVRQQVDYWEQHFEELAEHKARGRPLEEERDKIRNSSWLKSLLG